jgi:hypothetical protein
MRKARLGNRRSNDGPNIVRVVPTCAAAPREWCCEIANGTFRRDAHFARLLSAAGQGASSRQHKPGAEVLPNVLRRQAVPTAPE